LTATITLPGVLPDVGDALNHAPPAAVSVKLALVLEYTVKIRLSVWVEPWVNRNVSGLGAKRKVSAVPFWMTAN
jgi:hypothetical protein